jgi:VanZ family protein
VVKLSTSPTLKFKLNHYSLSSKEFDSRLCGLPVPCVNLPHLYAKADFGEPKRSPKDEKMESVAEIRSQTRRERFWRYGPLVIWMLLIFLASTGELSAANTSRILRPLLLWLFPDISEEGLTRAHFLVRKAAHFTEYAILALLAARAFITSTHERLRRIWFITALLLVILYSLSDEYHQSFVPSRTASVYDSFIDMAGGLTALVLYRIRKASSQ